MNVADFWKDWSKTHKWCLIEEPWSVTCLRFAEAFHAHMQARGPRCPKCGSRVSWQQNDKRAYCENFHMFGIDQAEDFAQFFGQAEQWIPVSTFKQHTDHVQQFLNDLWAFSIDPLHEGMGGLKVAQVCTALLDAAQKNRDAVYELGGLFRTACLWVWKGLDVPGQTLESTMEAMRKEYAKESEQPLPSPPRQRDQHKEKSNG